MNNKLLLIRFRCDGSLGDLQKIDFHDCEISQVGFGVFEAKIGPWDQISEATKQPMTEGFILRITRAGFEVPVVDSTII